MARACTICGHPELEAINRALVEGTHSNRRIASHHDVTERAVRNHKANHLPATLAKAHEAEEAAQADDLLGRVEDLHRRTLAVLEAAEGTGELRTALAAIREARSNVELLARLLRELDNAPGVAVVVNAPGRPSDLEREAAFEELFSEIEKYRAEADQYP